MKRLLLPFAALFVAAAAPAPAPAPRVVETPSGWTFGKAGAPLLVEYASFGCPHCGEFAAGAGKNIEQAVKAGKLRFAFRPFLIFPQDRAAAVLARCVAPSRRLGFIHAVMLAQGATRAKYAAADADEALRGRLFEAELAGPLPYARLLAEFGGLGDIARAHGLTASAQQQCLVSEANHRWVTAADLAARTDGITGTPTYLWKGERLGHDLTPAALLARLPR